MMKRLFTTLFIALVSMATTWATDYDLWICGTRVTSDNATSGLSSINGVGCGYVYYDASANALYLYNTYLVTTGTSVYPIKAGSGVSGLKIMVSGVCSIETKARVGLWLDNCSNVEILGDGTYGDGSLTIKSTSYDILLGNSNSNKVSIKDGVSLFLLGGGINYSGTTSKTLVVDNAELLVRRTSSSSSPVMVHNLTLTNAYLSSPAWTTYTWNGTDLTKGNLTWADDIHIKPGEAPASGGTGGGGTNTGTGGDVNGDGNVTLADVTRLVDIILRGGDERDYVDLGLPSGTLWATCNIGAESPEEYGLYFAWGETVGHTANEGYDFSVNYYKWYNPPTQKYTKYCTDAQYGTVDNRTELEPTDDAAYVNWGPLWCMPTKEQIEELINPDYTYSFETNVNGVLGVRIRSIANGNSIFLPYAGHFYGTFNGGTGDGNNAVCYFWTKSLQTVVNLSAYSICIESNYDNSTARVYLATPKRYYGLPIRPVRAR